MTIGSRAAACALRENHNTFITSCSPLESRETLTSCTNLSATLSILFAKRWSLPLRYPSPLAETRPRFSRYAIYYSIFPCIRRPCRQRLAAPVEEAQCNSTDYFLFRKIVPSGITCAIPPVRQHLPHPCQQRVFIIPVCSNKVAA